MTSPEIGGGGVGAQSAHVLMCKQWWKVCWMYGDQEKYYRQLYGSKRAGGAPKRGGEARGNHRRLDVAKNNRKNEQKRGKARTESGENGKVAKDSENGRICDANLSGVEFHELLDSDEELCA